MMIYMLECAGTVQVAVNRCIFFELDLTIGPLVGLYVGREEGIDNASPRIGFEPY